MTCRGCIKKIKFVHGGRVPKVGEKRNATKNMYHLGPDSHEEALQMQASRC